MVNGKEQTAVKYSDAERNLKNTESSEEEFEEEREQLFNQKNSLKGRLIKWFVFVALIIPIVAGTLTISLYYKGHTEISNQNLSNTASFFNSFISYNIIERSNDIKALAKENYIAKAAKLTNTRDIVSELNKYVAYNDIYDMIMVFDRAGRLRNINDISGQGKKINSQALVGLNQSTWQWSTLPGDNEATIEWFNSCIKPDREKAYITKEIRQNKTFQNLKLPEYNIFFAMPIKQRGQVIGCVVSAFSMEKMAMHYKNVIASVKKGIKSFDISIMDKNGIIIWESFENNQRAFLDNLKLTNDPLYENWKSKGFKSYESEMLDKRTGKKIFASIQTIEEFNWAVISKADKSEVQKSSINIFLISIITTLLLMILTAFLIYKYTKKITMPIQSSAVAIEKIGYGDLRVQVEVESQDELGKLQFFINEMANHLRTLVRALTGSRSVSTTYSHQAAKRVKDILRSNQEQAALLEEASAAVEELSASTQSILEASQKQLKGAETNSKAMDDLQDSFIKSADIQRQITKEASQTMEQARSGGDAVQILVVSMEEIFETSQKILGIIDVINDIADQTDLLALNASIEAARAGEHGKGFAVVAHEISELAERSSTSAKEISRLLRTANQKVEDGTEKVRGTREIFSKIINSMESLTKDIKIVREFDTVQSGAVNETAQRARNVALLAKEIADATRLQNQSAEEITDDMSRANEITSDNVEQIEKLDSLLKELESLMEEGLKLVHQFKLPSKSEEDENNLLQ
ncbi:MAG: methyl-accepting chemotaxis protein [Spirochaetia bacterium]|nr:methyl-accepting chemotaxis protein [Spirochaetia bacterium]